MLTEGRNPLSQRVSECRRARGRRGVQWGLRSSSLPSWCLSCCGNVYVGAGDKGPLSPTSPLFTGVRGRVILRSSYFRRVPDYSNGRTTKARVYQVATAITVKIPAMKPYTNLSYRLASLAEKAPNAPSQP